MKKPTLFLLVVFLTLCSLSVKADNFNDKEKAIVYTNALELLNNYESTINRIGEFVVTDVERAKSEAEGLLELFVNRQVLVYNDLDPAHRLSEFYEAETYGSNIILWYPDGISISLDLKNAKVSEIIDHGDNIYSIDVLVKKNINGNYLNQAMNTNTEELSFRIAFRNNNRSVSNFRIVGIRSSTSDYAIDDSEALREVNAEDFNEDDLVKIQSEITTIVRDYANYLSLLGNPQELDEDKQFYRRSFIDLFDSTGIKVYNDINPEPERSLITVDEYLDNYRSHYPDGINNLSINVDSLNIGNIVKEGENNYYTYVNAEKFFSGKFKGSEVFRDAFDLKFRIEFNAAGKTFSDFSITGIDMESVDFFLTEATAGETPVPQFIIKPVSRKGFYISVHGSAGQTTINDQNINNLTLAENLHAWEVSPDYGFISGIGMSYYFTNNFALKTGAEFSKYTSLFNLSGSFEDNELSTDLNSDSYYKNIDANLDSLVNLNLVNIPLLISFTSGEPGRFGLFIDAGVSISIPVQSTYNNSGSYKLSGYYPAEVPVLQYKDPEDDPAWEALGFYYDNNIDETGDLEINTFNLSLYGSIGVNIPLGYYSSITVGPEIVYGITDILSNKNEYVDIFGNSLPKSATRIRSIGLKISFAYKL